MKVLKNPRVMMILAVAMFGTLGPLVRNIPVTSGELALYRAVMASVLLGAFLLISKSPLQLGKIRKELPLLLLSGAAIGLNWILLFEAYRYTTISVATLSYYAAPVLVTLACPLLFRERMGRKQWICFAMSTFGIVLITGFDAAAGNSHFTGILFGLGAAVLYAGVILSNKFIRGVSGIQRTFLQFLAATAVLIPYVACTDATGLSGLDMTGWGCLLTVGIIHTGVTYCLYFSALEHLSGQETAILSYVDPLVAVFLSFFVLGEPITLTQILGGGLILGFTLWNEIG